LNVTLTSLFMAVPLLFWWAVDDYEAGRKREIGAKSSLVLSIGENGQRTTHDLRRTGAMMLQPSV